MATMVVDNVGVSKKKVMVRTLLFQPVTVAKLSTSMVDILKIAPIFSFGINMAVIHKSGISPPSKAQRDAPNSAKTSRVYFATTATSTNAYGKGLYSSPNK